ncbi:MAG: Rad52/Rad22 family DNA repair protein [Gemmatimonadetes bacterium]|nr:Rad52/Rad22 family DNA repair protein [Gemmatimonadota bacterium]
MEAISAETALLPEVDVEAIVGECYVPFPSNVIKIRNDAGTGGKDLSYVGHPEYTRRLDRLFPFSWSFHTEIAGLTDTTVGVKGSLSITLEDGRVVTRENYGHGNINRGFPLGDAMKTACVDALKKCCSMFGIGLHLYDGDDDNASRASNGRHHNGHYDDPLADPGHDWLNDPNPPPREQGPERYEVGPGEAATSKQIVALQNIAKSSKTDGDLADEINRKLKTPPKDGEVRITKREASDLISRAFGEK